MRLIRYLLLVFLVCPLFAYGQGSRKDDVATKNLVTGLAAAPGALITVCTSAGVGVPCTPLASIYSDVGLTSLATNGSAANAVSCSIGPTTNPCLADSNGNYGFYASPGRYVVTVTGAGTTGKSVVYTMACDPSAACTVSGTTTLTGGRPWIDVTGAPYNADPTGVADSTAGIQAAHNACAAFATGPCNVFFPYGTYKVTSALTWSPYVPILLGGRVIWTTAIASGNFFSISDQYGKPTPDPNSNGTTRSSLFNGGTIQFINTNVANTAIPFFIGGASAGNFATELSLNGFGSRGFLGGTFLVGFNGFALHVSNCFAFENRGPTWSSLVGATNQGESIYIDGCVFGNLSTNPSPGFFLSWNTNSATDFHIQGTSIDYLAGFSDPAQSAPNTVVNGMGIHAEWNETARPYFDITGGMKVSINGIKFSTPLTTGFFTPFAGRVNGTSVLSFTGTRTEAGGTIPVLYDNASGTGGLLNIDPINNTANTVTTYFTKTGGAGGIVTFNSVPANLPAAYDMSAYSLGVGVFYLGGNSGATNIPQWQANSGSTCGGITGSNYILLRAGVAVTECHATAGDVGITGALNVTGAPIGAANANSNGFDSTTKTPVYNANNNGLSAFSGAWNCTNVTPVTVNANVATDQNLMACTIPAGTLNRVGRSLRIFLAGVYSTEAANASTVRIKVKLCTVSGCGSGTVITPISIVSGAQLGGQANDAFNVSCTLTVQTAGASAAFEAHGNLALDGITAATVDSVYADTNIATVGTIDSTAQLFLQITGTFSVAGAAAGNIFTERQQVSETVN